MPDVGRRRGGAYPSSSFLRSSGVSLTASSRPLFSSRAAASLLTAPRHVLAPAQPPRHPRCARSAIPGQRVLSRYPASASPLAHLLRSLVPAHTASRIPACSSCCRLGKSYRFLSRLPSLSGSTLGVSSNAAPFRAPAGHSRTEEPWFVHRCRLLGLPFAPQPRRPTPACSGLAALAADARR